MGYSKHADAVYVVQWPSYLTKIGVTTCQRWRKFVRTGATIVGVWNVQDGEHGFKAEELLHNEVLYAHETIGIFDMGTDQWKQQMQPYLGPDLGGFTECSYLRKDITHQQLREQIECILNSSEHCYTRMLPMHAS